MADDRSKHDDGNLGWAENGPFDAILLTCAAPALVTPLLAQLGDPGVLVSPVGTEAGKQKLTDEWTPVNKAAALWTRPKSDITDAQYRAQFLDPMVDDLRVTLLARNRYRGSH